MNNIENMYISYDQIFKEFSDDIIKSRYENLYEEIKSFIDTYSLNEHLTIDEVALTHAVLDYYTDVSRLKKLHNIAHINDIKVCAYESYWLLRRHPIQIQSNPNTEEKIVFANEKFVFSRISQFIMKNNMKLEINDENKKSILNYLDTFYYYLKYRDYNAQVLELMILSFRAGVLVGENIK